MKNKMKHYIDLVVNGVLLKPFNLKLSYNLGSNPMNDMKRLLQAQRVDHVVDGGAYRGDFSLQAADSFPAATVYAFEPLKSSFELLTRNTETVHRIKPINRALGAANGNAVFYTNASPLTNSLSKSTSDAMRYFQGFNDPKGTENVEVVSLKDFLSQENITGIGILKLDLQGHELQAIQGLGDMLSSVKLIYAEVEFLRLYEGTSLFSEVEMYLREREFIFYQLYNLVRSPENGRLLYGDAIFTNSKFSLI